MLGKLSQRDIGTLLPLMTSLCNEFQEVNDLLCACDEVLTSAHLTKVLEYLLSIGNYMNANWNSKHGVPGFQLTSIEKVRLKLLSYKVIQEEMNVTCSYFPAQGLICSIWNSAIFFFIGGPDSLCCRTLNYKYEIWSSIPI